MEQFLSAIDPNDPVQVILMTVMSLLGIGKTIKERARIAGKLKPIVAKLKPKPKAVSAEDPSSPPADTDKKPSKWAQLVRYRGSVPMLASAAVLYFFAHDAIQKLSEAVGIDHLGTLLRAGNRFGHAIICIVLVFALIKPLYRAIDRLTPFETSEKLSENSHSAIAVALFNGLLFLAVLNLVGNLLQSALKAW